MKALSESELSIMLKIWDCGRPMTLNEICDAVREMSWSPNTIRNFLSRIVAKGYLTVDRPQRKNLYRALVDKDYVEAQSRKMIRDYYNDSAPLFVARLYETDNLSDEELRELSDYLNGLLAAKTRE